MQRLLHALSSAVGHVRIEYVLVGTIIILVIVPMTAETGLFSK